MSPNAPAQTPAQQHAQAAAPPLPFIHAAKDHTEQAFSQTLTIGATTQQVLQGAAQALPAEGFLRNVYCLFTNSGGTVGSAAASADFPWNAVASVTLSDVNGAPLFGPVDGYSWYLINKYGGYMFRGDPLIAPDSSTGLITFAYALRVPVEVNRQTGFGSLANQNAAAAYKLTMTLNTNSIWTVQPTTPPNTNVLGYIETWTQPLPQDVMGRQQETEPPAHGTTQYWTMQQYTVNGGQQSITLTRVGNLIRCLILIYRDNTGARVTFASGHMPNPIEIDWDARQYRIEPLYFRREAMTQKFGAGAANTVEDGVMVYNFDDVAPSGHTGGGSTARYLPTVEATRLQITANWAVAGTLTVLTCDIAPAETNPALRYAAGSATGFHPEVGTPIPGMGS